VTRRYWNLYFAQGEDGAAALDRLDDIGADAWLDEIDTGAEMPEPESRCPWGLDDRQEHVEPSDPAGGLIEIRTNRRLGYVSVTQHAPARAEGAL
jgi:hypothetical protein